VALVSGLLAATGNGKALWYLTRGTGAVALVLLTAGLVLGVTSTLGWRSRRLPRFLVSGLHRNVTLLALAFVIVHVVTTVVDQFAPVHLWDAVIPFVSAYRPVWLGLGAVAFDLLLALIVTSLLRARIGVRTWRAVHFLAYASWPVALVHSLGTGSDVRSGWLQLLAVACALAVALAVLLRLLTVRGGALRAAAALGALAVPIGVLVWARGGPLRAGWAARAGTPSRLLRPAGVRPARPLASVTRAATVPAGSFTSTLSGTLRETTDSRGLVVVQIDAGAHGSFDGRVHLQLRGVPLAGGGVEMTDSVVGVLPTGAPAWLSGSVSGLNGQRIVADVGNGAQRRQIRLDLTIDAAARTVGGTLSGAAASGGDSGE
jgi:sulfoxide reductase heme-binding subunit YedZ